MGNAAWSTDLKSQVSRIASNRSAFYGGYLKDQKERGPLMHLLSGRWDGRCRGPAAAGMPILIWVIFFAALVLAASIGIGLVAWQRRRAVGKASQPLLAADR